MVSASQINAESLGNDVTFPKNNEQLVNYTLGFQPVEITIPATLVRERAQMFGDHDEGKANLLNVTITVCIAANVMVKQLLC